MSEDGTILHRKGIYNLLRICGLSLLIETISTLSVMSVEGSMQEVFLSGSLREVIRLVKHRIYNYIAVSKVVDKRERLNYTLLKIDLLLGVLTSQLDFLNGFS